MSSVDHVQVLIIGGGITGAGIFRDLSLHGLKCLLIDKKDFAGQTSWTSSKMFHGGIRYLEHYEFKLVWEALHEKNHWLKQAPHLCYEKPFFMPVFNDSKNPLWLLGMGVKFYDLLSGFQNSPSKVVFAKDTIKKIPQIRSNGLIGSAIYHDAIVDDSKMALENIYDGLLNKISSAESYTELMSLEKSGQKIKATMQEAFTQTSKTVIADHVVFATGPFTDDLLAKFDFLNWTPQMLPSKGSHIWIKRDCLQIDSPMVIMTKDNRIIFVIPHEKAILVGTTELPAEKDKFDLKCSDQEVEYLLANLQEYFPSVRISKDHILSSFAGVRPLVKQSNKESDRGKTARNHKIFNPQDNIHVIIGGKLTTFRIMGQPISKKICSSFKLKYDSSRTKAPLRIKSRIPAFYHLKSLTREDVITILQTEHVKTFKDLVHRRLSVQGRKHWDLETPFDDFFIQLLPEMQKYIFVGKQDILSFE